MKKKYLLILLTLTISFKLFSQDSYRKRYFIKDSIKFKEKIYLNNKEVDSIYYLKIETLNDGKLSSSISEIAKCKKGLKANVKFDENKTAILWINPWLVTSNDGKYVDRDSVYFFKLKNRQSVKVDFKQWSLNALTVPLKIRFGEKTEFSTGANLGALIGHTWGRTTFVHRKKVGNKQYDSKLTVGLFLGADKLEFSYKNSDDEDIGVKSAFVSSGLGILYSYENFSFGLTSGFDFGLGENSSEWDYQGKPWLGIALGYSLFSF